MEITLNIQNLKCGGCANTVVSKLSKLKGITNVLVNNEDSSVTLDYESNSQLNDAKTVLKQIGYPEVGDHNALGTKAKSFVSCAIGRINS